MRAKSSAFTLVELLVVIAIIGILVALLLPAIQAARESSNRTHCSNNLKQIGLALQTYLDAHKKWVIAGDDGPNNCCSPDTGRFDRYGWPYHILPFMEQSAVYDLGKTSRSQLNQSIVKTFYCPTRRQLRLYRKQAKSDYAGSRGSGNNGIFSRSRTGWIGFGHVSDGTSNTIAVAETRIHRKYMEHGQANYWGDNESLYLSGWADDVVRYGARRPAPDLNDYDQHGSLTHNQFGSSHAQGMNAVLGDGSVRFITFLVDATVFLNGTIRDDSKNFNINELK